MNKLPLVSIIIPVHNAESYLEQCIESITSQTYKNIEVICVNDHSTDGSLSILENNKLKDERIKLFNVLGKESGPGFARNIGLDHANGDFISFCDSDDIMSNVIIEKMVNRIIKDNSDIIFCTHKNLYKDGLVKERKFRPIFFKTPKYIYTNKLYKKIFDLPFEPWNKLYRFSVLKEIRFPPNITLGEDVPFTLDLVLRSKKVSFLDIPLYIYRIRKDSLCHQTSIIDSNFISKHMSIVDVLKKYNLDNELMFTYKNYFLKDAVFRFNEKQNIKDQITLINNFLTKNNYNISNINILLILLFCLLCLLVPFGRSYIHYKIKNKFFALKNEKDIYNLINSFRKDELKI